MAKIQALFEEILGCLNNPDNQSLALSLDDVHNPGLFSLVVRGTEFGKLTRIFIADKKITPFDVQFHTHRYGIILTAIKGTITHHIAEINNVPKVGNVHISQYDYKSFLNGGSGLTYEREVGFVCNDYKMPPGSSVRLRAQDYHTVSCSKGAIWIVEETGFETDSSKVLGVPFIVDGLYNKAQMFGINDKCQLVKKELQLAINAFNSVGNGKKGN